MNKIKYSIYRALKLLTLCTSLFFFIVLLSVPGAFADNERVIFGVDWYDVGQTALEGRQGIKQVTSGWRGSMEINTVDYDPAVISIKEMEKALKKSGTYKKTIKDQ